ncbi:MAG TPA: ATP-binding protein [Ruminococcaceae bacterium]|nr:ATP-binding protein [Oscillospiraceae bacterium]
MREWSLHLLDIAQNSISAGASRIEMRITFSASSQELTVTVADNGCGMTPQQLERVTDPFYTTRTTRKVGLGVPLMKQSAEQTGGSFSIKSEVGKGTELSARFCTNHVDCAPVGDLASTVVTLIALNDDRDFLLDIHTDQSSYTLDTHLLRTVLDPVPLNEAKVLQWIKEALVEQTQNLSGGVKEYEIT